MDTIEQIDRLCDGGVRFSITPGPNGYVVKLGNYAHQATPSIEAKSLDEAVIWLRAYVALGLVN